MIFMTQNRPMTADEIREKEALHNALQSWLGGMSMSKLDNYHQQKFGHSFEPSFDDMPEEPRQSNYTALGNDER